MSPVNLLGHPDRDELVFITRYRQHQVHDDNKIEIDQMVE